MKLEIKVDGFRKRYRNCFVSIKDMSIRKRITLICGPNGSGKSTLLKAMAGFISYEGQITGNYSYSYYSEVSSYPEDINILDFHNNLMRLSEKKVEYAVLYDNLSYLGLESKIEEEISNLSKGMKAKAGLLFCLSQSANVYLLDEPLSGLDRDSIKEVKKMIVESNKIFIITSHLQSELFNIAEEVIHLD